MLIASIVVAVLVIAVWTVVLVLAWPWWIALIVTLVAVIGMGVAFLVRYLLAKARSQALERELMRQAAQQAERARPDRRPEIIDLQKQMREALETLKRTKLRGSGGGPLYALPWYIIVGPPAAGKTTALEKSGLSFTSPAGKGPRLRGTAGTRNCDWWFSKDAILLDTAGRFAVEDDDQEEWFSFLDTVKRFRRRRPIDGVIVALSVNDLVSANDTQIEDLAQKLRARVDELMSRLEMILPVYVMFTKADLIAGFAEFWGNFNKSQRAKPWGATFPLDHERNADPRHGFESEFDQLVQALHARMLERLHGEPMPDVRSRVLQFPVEFQSLKAPLSRFVEELCRPNPYQETPILRGFYFTSGTQVGRPLDRVLSNMMRGFNLRAPAVRAAGEPHSYFVTDLFKTIIFPDQHLAVRSTGRLSRVFKTRVVLASLAFLTTLALIVVAALSYVDNSDLLGAVSREIDEVSKLEGSSKGDAGVRAEALGRLLDRVDSLRQIKDQFRIPGLYGPRAARQLYEPLHALYVTRLKSAVDGPVKDQLTADVRAIGDLVRTDAQNFEAAYSDLKLYVMLATAPDHLDAEWAKQRLGDVWARTFRPSTTADQERSSLHAQYYLEALAANKSWALVPDDGILARARSRLSTQPLEEIQYGWLLSQAKGLPPVRSDKVFYGPAGQFVTMRGRVEVPGHYTKAGWEKVRAALDSSGAKLVLEPWVLGVKAVGSEDDQKKASGARLQEIYFQRYERAWDDFLGSIDVVTPTNLGQARDELRVLSESDGPYTRVFRVFSENVVLDMGATNLFDKALEKGKAAAAGAVDKLTGKDAGAEERVVSPVEEHFQPLLKFAQGDSAGGKPDAQSTALAQYIAQLTTLEVALGQLSESKGEPSVDFDRELARTAGAVSRLLGGFDAKTRLVLEPLLMNPIRGSRAGVASSANASLEEKWKAEVLEIWNTKLAPRYPFADSAEEVALSEFGDFFRPTLGILWKFYDKNLADRLDRTGNDFTPKPSADPVPFRGDFLRCLSSAQAISEAIFGSGPDMNVPFSIMLQPIGADVSEITFRIDGQAIVYRNEPERWVPTQWPGKGVKGAILEVKGTSGFTDQMPRTGDFGLFRLLAIGNLKPLAPAGSDAAIFAASFNLNRAGEAPATIQLRPGKSTHPFSKDFFRRMKCPPGIVQGAALANGASAP